MKNLFTKSVFIGMPMFLLGMLLIGAETKSSITKYHANSMLYSGGAPSGRTGAPGEANCTACHNGSAQDGSGVNELILNDGGTEYTAGETVPMTLTLTDDAIKNGFQLVALKTNDEMAGSFTITDNTNTKFVTSSLLNRDYVTHTSNGTASNSWTFDWDAPIEGGDVTFYVASNKTNNNGASDSGDIIYLSQHTFNAPDVSSVSKEVLDERLDILYSSQKNAIVADFEINKSANISFNVVGLDGKSVYFKNAQNYVPGAYSEMLKLPDNINNGIYITTLFIGNKPLSKKVFISGK